MSLDQTRKPAPRTKRLLLAVACCTLVTCAAAHAAPPFDVVKGTWGGGGKLNREDGKSEKLACNGYYTSAEGGEKLTIALRCTGETNNFELRGHLNNAAGKVSGTWEERTFNASGDASGSLKPGRLTLRFGGGIAGSMSVAFSQSSQAIAISIATSGAVVKSVNINLGRR